MLTTVYCTTVYGKKKSTEKTCTKKAKYRKGDQCFCEVHAKAAANRWLIPEKRFQRTCLNQRKVGELLEMIDTYHVPHITNRKLTKKEIVILLDAFFQERCFERIDVPKIKHADAVDLITIGRNLRDALDRVPGMDQVTHAIMENQISPLAGRMKTLQGMLAQYFIVRHPLAHIAFISSANKLKDVVIERELPLANTTTTNLRDIASRAYRRSPLVNTVLPATDSDPAPVHNKYRQHKQDAIQHTRHLLDTIPSFESWKMMFEEAKTKKDDLADCLLPENCDSHLMLLFE